MAILILLPVSVYNYIFCDFEEHSMEQPSTCALQVDHSRDEALIFTKEKPSSRSK